MTSIVSTVGYRASLMHLSKSDVNTLYILPTGSQSNAAQLLLFL